MPWRNPTTPCGGSRYATRGSTRVAVQVIESGDRGSAAEAYGPPWRTSNLGQRTCSRPDVRRGGRYHERAFVPR
ncbi:MAG TPA: hypothetical protein VGN72_02845 [Tepidisphaeraceae bacterium]|nr:hypothetical protein [Tepidisphaeraceae bacterium]